MFGVSRFKDRVILVAGAEHPLGASLCERLARFGAMVVAVGWADSALLDIAARAPSRIEPLVLSQGRRDVMDLLREAWEAEPLHAYIDLMPIMDSARGDAPHTAFAHSAGMASALSRGMQAGRARAMIAIPQSPAMSPEEQARSAGYTALMQRFAREVHPARLLGVGLPGPGFDWSGPVTVSAGDTIMMLAHDVSRGLRAGTLVEWDAQHA